jgi:hypothetical protein
MIYNQLHPLAKSELDRLKADGYEISINDIIWLHELAKKTDSIEDTSLYQFISKKVAGIDFYPLTYGAKLWLIDAKEKYQQNNKIYNLLELYTYSHARDKSSFNFKNDRQEKNAILDWGRSIFLTEQEFRDIVVELDSAYDSDLNAEKLLFILIDQIKNNPSNIDLTKIQEKIYDDGKKSNRYPCIYIAKLMYNYGKTEEEWMWNTPFEVGIDLINKIDMVTGKGKSSDDNSIIAFKNLKMAVSILKGRYGKG